MGKLNAKSITEALQKAKFLGKSASDALKEIQSKETEKKENAPVPVNSAGEVEVPKQSILEKASSFTKAVASRGVTNNKAKETTIQLRVMSCHGDESVNFPPCPHRQSSKNFANSFYCGACGCGDKQMTQLTQFEINGKMSTYTKLHYPKVTCPLKMPGFTNYQSCSEDENTANDRKQFIEFKESIDYIKENI
jgi:hypothetical protein